MPFPMTCPTCEKDERGKPKTIGYSCKVGSNRVITLWRNPKWKRYPWLMRVQRNGRNVLRRRWSEEGMRVLVELACKIHNESVTTHPAPTGDNPATSRGK